MQMIIAGNLEQARTAAELGNLRLHDWQYAAEPSNLRHVRPGSTVWLVGTYYEREDYDELAELCAARDIGLVCV